MVGSVPGCRSRTGLYLKPASIAGRPVGDKPRGGGQAIKGAITHEPLPRASALPRRYQHDVTVLSARQRRHAGARVRPAAPLPTRCHGAVCKAASAYCSVCPSCRAAANTMTRCYAQGGVGILECISAQLHGCRGDAAISSARRHRHTGVCTPLCCADARTTSRSRLHGCIGILECTSRFAAPLPAPRRDPDYKTTSAC